MLQVPVWIQRTNLISLTLQKKTLCNICPRTYSQRQGVLRHIRAAHKVHNLCIFPGCKFAWTRRYLYNAHVKTQHSDGNRGKVLGKSARSPPASKMIERSHRPPSFCRRSQAELGRRPLTQVTQVPFRAMSPVVYDAQPKTFLCFQRPSCGFSHR
ncbi:hypothetical protein BJV77DRAFT_241966 [Russula vinacea]|nr:hypothetical protein BJV77DRAFT_241966 [Russula vinacea]